MAVQCSKATLHCADFVRSNGPRPKAEELAGAALELRAVDFLFGEEVGRLVTHDVDARLGLCWFHGVEPGCSDGCSRDFKGAGPGQRFSG